MTTPESHLFSPQFGISSFEIRHSNTKKKARAVKDGVVKDESQNTVKTVRSQKVDEVWFELKQ